MTVLQAIALGALQGATEFLPVSSSGHLVVARELFGVAHIPVLFDVLLHVATLIAVVVMLRGHVAAFFVAIARAIGRRAGEVDRVYLRLIPLIVVTTIVTGAVGIGLNRAFDIRAIATTSAMFLVTALLLMLTRRAGGARTLSGVGWLDTLRIGIAQGFGVLPGISRSGITISAALFTGFDRRTAGEYSFLLSIPAILGALVLTAGEAGDLGSAVSPLALIAGCATALAVGLASLAILLRIVRAGRLYLFAIYLVPLGLTGLLVLAR